MKRALVALVGLLLAGCQGEPEKKPETKWLPVERAPTPRETPALAADAAPAAPPGITPEHTEAAAAIEAWFKTLAAAARGSATDCVAMARAIESVGAKGRPIVARAKQMQQKLDDPLVAYWMETHIKQKMESGYNELVAAMGLCAENSTVKKAMKAIAR